MVRELKFRAWNPNANKFEAYAGVQNMPLHEVGALMVKIPVLEVQQYTGLKDKNGAEIYEGDIVRCKVKDDKDKRRLAEHYVSDVYWDIDGWCVHDSPNCDTQLGRFDNQGTKIWPTTTIEVIGNIHENPELLGKIGEDGE